MALIAVNPPTVEVLVPLVALPIVVELADHINETPGVGVPVSKVAGTVAPAQTAISAGSTAVGHTTVYCNGVPNVACAQGAKGAGFNFGLK